MARTPKYLWIQWTLFAIDVASVVLPALYFRRTTSLIYPGFILLLLPFVFRENILYWRHAEVFRTYWHQFGQIIRSYGLIFIFFAVFVFLSQVIGMKPHANDLLLLLALIVILNVAWRLIFVTLLNHLYGYQPKRFLVIGTSPRAQVIAEEIRNEPKFMSFCGYLSVSGKDPEAGRGDLPAIPDDEIVGGLDELKQVVERTNAAHIIVVLDEVDLGTLLKVMDEVANLPIVAFVYNKHFDIIRERYRSRPIGDYTVIAIASNQRELAEGTVGHIFKTITDYAGAAVLLIFCSPLFAFIAVLIKLDSPGPVFYIANAVRRPDGSTFPMFKFRSMYVSNDEPTTERLEGLKRHYTGQIVDKGFTKVVNRSCVTPFGRFLRKSSLDELPQLLNVLRGEMSLVGPRPCLPIEYDHYTEWQKRRLDVKPGITGLWQVIGRSTTGFEEGIIIDLYYIEHWTPWLDFEIILRTVPVVLFRRGAA